MPTCYNCGRKIEEGTGVRKEVYTGRSKTTGIFGKRLWYGGREHYGMRLFCENCVKPSIAEGIFALVKLALIIILAWWFIKKC